MEVISGLAAGFAAFFLNAEVKHRNVGVEA